MKQRAMIAMALACRPALLIADEPTTALDVTVQAQILALLERLRRELDMAMILITHDLGVVAEACDDVAVMYGGRIVERAAVGELLRHPRHPYTRGLMRAMPKAESTNPDQARAGCRAARAPAGDRRPGAAARQVPRRGAASPRAARTPPTTAAPPRRRWRRRITKKPRTRTTTRTTTALPRPRTTPPAITQAPAGGRVRDDGGAASGSGDGAADLGARSGEALPRARGFGAPIAAGRARGRRRLLRPFRGRDAGAGRRVGLGQDDARADGAAAHRPDRGADPVRGQGPGAPAAPAAARAAPPHADDLSGPGFVAEPAHAGRGDRRRAAGDPRHRRDPRRTARARGRAAGAGRPVARRARPPPARVLGRPAPAHRHRARAGVAPAPDRRRRTDLGAGRLDPGPDRESVSRPAGRAGAGVPVHLARPQGGAAPRPSRRRHVPGRRSSSSRRSARSTARRRTPTRARCCRRSRRRRRANGDSA